MKIEEIFVFGILSSCQNQTMVSSAQALAPTQTLGELCLVWVTGNLESVGGILIKIWTNFNKNWDNTPTYLLDTAHKKHSLEIIWLDKKSPWSESGLGTDGYSI